MKYVEELMTQELVTHQPEDSLRDAETTMAQYRIRHIPVVNADNRLLGLMSQREFLSEAFRITDKFGSHHLSDYLAKTQLEDAMATNLTCVQPATPLHQAGKILQENRAQGCLLVTDDKGILVGLLTSQDFVTLAIQLLEQEVKPT